MTPPGTTGRRRPSRLIATLAGTTVTVFSISLTGYLIERFSDPAVGAKSTTAAIADQTNVRPVTQQIPLGPADIASASPSPQASQPAGVASELTGEAGEREQGSTAPNDELAPDSSVPSPSEPTRAPDTTPDSPTRPEPTATATKAEPPKPETSEPTPTHTKAKAPAQPTSIPVSQLQHPQNAQFNVKYAALAPSVGQVMTGNIPAGSSRVSMTPLWDGSTYPNQRWTLTDKDSDGRFRITMGAGSNCLYASSTVSTASCTDGALFRWGIVIFTNQTGGHAIKNYSLNQCLTATKDSAVTMQNCTGGANQTWRLGTLN